jgi:effector-binding domain-containing protein
MSAATVEVGSVRVDARGQRHTVGIRFQTPFRGMFAEVDKGLRELRAWVNAHGVADEGPFLLRYHVIDMAGTMDVEVAFVVSEALEGDDRVRPGVLPSGRYASLVYSRYAMRANKALIGWAEEHDAHFDRSAVAEGDAFACRYEAYLTDYRVEPRKSAWQIELAIKLEADA